MRELGSKNDFDLRLVFHLSELRAPADGIDLVVIPGPWVQPPVEKQSKQCPWLKLLVASTDNDTRVFILRYDIKSVEDGNVWHQLLALGRLLLDALRQARPFEVQKRPLFFICHSLGGIILKHALLLAQHDYPTIWNALSGLIFLGTPHLSSEDDPRWDNWRLILKLYRHNLPKTAMRRQDIQTLANVCEKFHSLNLAIPVISVYEMAKTKIRDAGSVGRLRGMERLLVDQAHATINTQHEELFGVDSSHDNLVNVRMRTPLFDRLVNYLKVAPVDGLAFVNGAYERLNLDIEFSDSYSQGYTEASSFGDRPKAIHAQEQLLESVAKPILQSERKQVLLPCYSLGNNRNRNFFGQEDILTLIDNALLPRSPTREYTESSPERSVAIKAFAVCGMGGLGKTEIAVEYIYSRRHNFDAIFWVNSANLEKLDSAFRDITLKLGLLGEEEVIHTDSKKICDIVKGWLENPVRTLGTSTEEESDVKWLLVFDNADEPDILFDFWPLVGTGSILLTSRNPLAMQNGFAEVSGVNLPPMPADDAGRFLQKITQRELEPSSLETCKLIAERLGGLPLALVQMAHGIRSKHLSLMEFLEYYEEDSRRFQEAPIPGLTKQQTIASIWNLESLPAPASALLRVLCVLDADGIPEEILVTGAKDVSLPYYPRTKVQYFEAREALIKSSLITRNIELRFIRIHRLVQDVVRQKLSIDELRNVFNAGVTLVTSIWTFVDSTTLHEVDRMRKVRKYLPQVMMFRSVLEDTTLEALRPDFKVSALFNEASWCYIMGPWNETLPQGDQYARLSRQVLELSNNIADGNRYSKILANAYRFQGIADTWLDNPDAVPCCKKWIDILVDRIEKYQEQADINDLAISYNELAVALMRVPDEEEAIKSWKMSCDALKQVTESENLPFPFPWMSRALVAAFNGDADTGYSILQPIIEERAKKLGVDDTSSIETGILISHMGTIRLLQGHRDDAIDLFRRGMSMLTTTSGEKSRFTIEASYRVAFMKFEGGEYREAAELLEKCINFYGDVPWYKPEAARASWKRGRTLQAENEAKYEAEIKELLIRAMRIRHELVPKDDRKEEELTDDDWDKLIFYLNR